MKNYILLGVGIGMIISGIIFSIFENKEHKELELIIRKELQEELKKEDVFTSFEKELEEMFSKEKNIVENENNNEIESNINFDSEKKENKVNKEKEELNENTIITVENKNNNMTSIAIEKFKPLKDEINDHSIQFRSSSNMDEIIRVQNMLNNIIDTKIEFIQGFYRLFANELYSKEYSEIIAHEIKNEFNLNPIIRNQKQLDYLILGPRKYAEKYESKDSIITEKINDKNISENIEPESIENKNLLDKDKKDVKDEEVIENVIEIKNINQDNISSNKELTFKLIFIEDGTYEESNEVEEKIKDLIELEIEENQEKYTVRSKESFNETISNDLVSKLKLLFDLNVKLFEEK